MMFAPKYTVWHCGYLKGEQEMSNAETSAVYAQEIMRLERENAAQLKELHCISESLETNEGHSSVTHIEILKEENATLRDNLIWTLHELKTAADRLTELGHTTISARDCIGRVEAALAKGEGK